MFLLLAIPLLLGYLCARRCLRRDDWPTLAGETAALAIVFTLVGVNAVYRQLGTTSYGDWSALDVSVAVTLAAQLLLLGLLAWKAPRAPAIVSALPHSANRLLWGLSAVVICYTNAQQIANPDDDYWIHAPLQGLMRAGNFPPFNPFFSDIAMNGHYGRNLSIVSFSWLSGLDVFMSQHLLTSAVAAITLWLFFSAFWRSSGSWQAGLLATVFVYFGINAGGRGGLIDTMQNNNVFVHLYLALLLSLFIDIWKDNSLPATWLAGLTLGSYAIVYETHFGLVFLTVISVTPLLALRGAIGKKAAFLAMLALLLSLPLAFTQGGPLTDLLSRRQEGRQHTQAENLSRGMQNQAQVVKITFPKEELFQILLETGEYQRVAHIYTLDTPLKRLHTPTVERGYAYIWSWDVLKIHFLPLYLFPLSLVVLWRRKSLAGHFLGAFGVISFLTPAIVHFGPIYESEYYRWQFAAALGFAGALGLTLAALLEGKGDTGRAPALVWRSPYLAIGPRGGRLLLVAALTLLNSWASLSFVGGRLSQALAGSPKEWLVFPSTPVWLEQHQVLDFDHLDYDAARWLAGQVRPGDRLLTNFAQENNFSILFESTLTGVTGARCVGHALPLEDEKIGTTPFRRAPAAVAFWETFRADPLSQLKANWVYYRNDRGEELPPLPGAKLVHRVQQGNRLRLVYQIDPAALPNVEISSENSSPPSTALLEASLSGQPAALRGGRLVELALQRPETSQKLSGVLELSTTRRSDGLVSSPSENLRLRLDDTFTVPFVPPYDEGEYTLNASWHPDPGTTALDIAPTEIRVAFASLVEEVRIAKVTHPEGDWGQGKVWPQRVLLRPETSLRLPPAWPQHDNDLLACWAFYSQERQEFDLQPALNLQRVSLVPGQPLTLAMVTPERSGSYRLSLYLSAGQGQLSRIPLGQVEIGAPQVPSL